MFGRSHSRKPGSSSSIQEAYLEHESFLKRFIAGFLPKREDVDEVAQESFLKAYAVELQRPIEKPKSLLFQIARNESITRLRRQSSRVVDYLEEIDASLRDSPDAWGNADAERDELLSQLCQVAATLPMQCRKAFLLRMVYGMSHKEIARKMGISVSTVEKHLALALQRCSQVVSGQQAREMDPEDGSRISRLKGGRT